MRGEPGSHPDGFTKSKELKNALQGANPCLLQDFFYFFIIYIMDNNTGNAQSEPKLNFGTLLSDSLGEALDKTKSVAKLGDSSGELSLVITKLEEALLWLGVCAFTPRTQDEVDAFEKYKITFTFDSKEERDEFEKELDETKTIKFVE